MKAEIMGNKIVLFPQTLTEVYAVDVFLNRNCDESTKNVVDYSIEEVDEET